MLRVKQMIQLVFVNLYTYRIDYIRVLAVSKIIELIILLPTLKILFQATLNLMNIQVVTKQNIAIILSHPLFLIVLFIAIFIVMLFIYYEMGFYMLLAYYQQRQIHYTLTIIWKRLNKKVFYFLILHSFLLVGYIVLLLPLLSKMLPFPIIQGLKFPHFVDEVLKWQNGQLLYGAFLLVILLFSLRFIFTMPFFVVNHRITVLEAIKESIRYSRGKTIETVGMLLFFIVINGSIFTMLLCIVFIPLVIIENVFPSATKVVSAFTLTIVQGILFIIFGLLQGIFSQILIYIAFRLKRRKPIISYRKIFQPSFLRWGVLLSIFCFLFWSVSNYLIITKFIYEPDTKIIAHRGFMEYGVENTISAVIAAAKAGVEMVEIDIQQTKDGEYVVFHDSSLNRLAGINKYVYNMTVDELTNVTVRSGNFSDKIPSLAQMLEISNKYDIQLLIELKENGYESADYKERLIAIIDQYHGLDVHYIQSSNYLFAQQLKEFEPRLHVGSVHSIALKSIPDIPLDFISIEQSQITLSLIKQAKAMNKEMFVWTVNMQPAMLNYLLQNVDGIITNHPDVTYIMRSNLDKDKHFIQRIFNKLK